MTRQSVFAIILATILSIATPAAGEDKPLSSTPVSLGAELIATGLDHLTYLTATPGDSSRLFVVEQPGRILVIRNGDLLLKPFLDITNKVLDGGERGLLSMAFDPDYKNNRRFYVNYTDNNGDTVVVRYQTKKKNPNVALKKSEAIILRIEQPYSNHNGGQLQFGPDGYLYIGMGDGGSGGDPLNSGQDLTSRLGKLLRIDVKELPYTIPSTNPFANPVESGIISHPETWACDLRNPWRFSFDRNTGDLYIADVGQSAIEEVNFQAASSRGGENYGWNIKEGSQDYNPNGSSKAGFVDPIHEYTHANGNCSVTGGYVYRGKAIAVLRGAYFFADYCSGRIWSFKYRNGKVTELTEWTETIGGPFPYITSFGEDADGELYFMGTVNGNIYKIINR